MKIFFLILASIISIQTKAAPTNDIQAYFKETYDEAKKQFLDSVVALKKANQFDVQQQSFVDPKDDTLTTDTALIHPLNTPPSENLIVVLSGLHGIEGFVGSALQSKWVQESAAAQYRNLDFLYVHALNPYGFKNKRRVNRDNIDMNRNFVVSENDYLIKNQAYADINSFLNPEHSVELNIFSRFGFIFSAVKLIFQYSLEALREAILKGQYQFQKGLYYGGEDHQYQKQFIDEIIQNSFSHYKKVFVLDIHTGYGEKNKLHVLAGSMKQSSAPELNAIFSEDRIDYGDKKKFYQTTGDLITYFESKSSAQTKIIGATFEFGTLDSQKTLGSIESLRRMVLENQNHFYPVDKLTSEAVDNLFDDMFYPKNLEFRQKAFEQSTIEFSKIIGHYK